MNIELLSAVGTLRLLAKVLVRVANKIDAQAVDDDVVPFSRSRSEANLIERNEPLLASLASNEYNSRRCRENFFDKELFGEASWDILLDLYVQRASGRQVSVTSSCIAANVPATTALRYIELLEANGLLFRKKSETDARTHFLSLTDQAIERMGRYLRKQLIAENSTEELKIQKTAFAFEARN